MTTRWTVRLTALVAAGALVAGCGGGGDEADPAAAPGQTSGEQTSGEQAGAPEVDPAALDTGDYRTTPQEPFGRATPEQMNEIEGQRLAEFVLVPFEIDPTLTEASRTPSVAQHAGQLAYSFSRPVLEAIKKTGIVTGFVAGASTPTADYTEVPRSIVHAVLRTGSPEDARRMASDMNEAALAGGDEYEKPDSPWVPLDDRLRDSLTTQSTYEDKGRQVAARQVFTAHRDYVIYGYASAPESDADWADRVLGDALEKQKPVTDAFPATPTKAQRGDAEPEYTQIDQDEILIYALPRGEDEEFVGDYMAVYGPRGMAHRSTNPPLAYKVLTEVGAEHNAVGGESTVYRAEDDAGAKRILDEFGADMINHGFAEAPSPQGLDPAECYAQTTERGEEIYCFVINGRYVGLVGGDDKKNVDQRTSAQYLVLTHADQEA